MNKLRGDTSILFLAATLLAAGVAPAQPQPVDATAPAGSDIPVTTVDAGKTSQQLTDQLAATLADGSLSQAQRDEAARRLLALRTPAALDLLRSSLAEQNPGGQIAVARALADDVRPDPVFVNSLFAALGANKTVTETAATALANYNDNPEVLHRLMDLATNRQRGNEVVRTSAIRALAAFPEKRSAETLLNLLRAREEPAAIKREAADALADLAAIPTNGVDAKQWDQWWAANSSKSDAQFRAELLNRKSIERNRDEQRLRHLQTAVENEMREEYQLTPAGQREALLMRWLTSPEPEIRARATDQIREDFTEAKTFSEPVIKQLRAMISDSSVLVRQRVALAFATKNDPQALDPLLGQLVHESDAGVKLQVANALRNMNDVRAAPALEHLLNDPSPEVARAAMNALKDIGETLLKQNPQLAEQVAGDLRRIIDRTNATDEVELRAAAVDALAPLHRTELMQLYFRLLQPQQEVTRVRIAALNALGDLHDQHASTAIIEAIGDTDDTVTLAAVKALGKVEPTADQLENLWPLLNPQNPQRDSSIRDAAWRDLESSLPTMNKEQLERWADRFRADPDRQIAILKKLLELQTADKDLDNAATTQFQIAACYMSQNQPDQAVPFFRAALDYRQSAATTGMLLDQLMVGYTNALLMSDKYEEAIAFASNTIKSDSGWQSTFGPLICARVEQLSQSQQPDQLKNGAKLVDLAKKMATPLGDQYVVRLDSARKTIDKQLANLSQQPSGPRSANGASMPAASRPAGIAGGGD